MATADDYAAWIVKNADKRGTPEFDTVVAAYQQAKVEDTVTTADGPASPARIEGRQASPWVRGAATLGQGMTFGFADELAGAANALMNPSNMGGAYEAQRDKYRGMVEQFQQEHPFVAPALDVTGSLVAGGPLAKMASTAIRPGISTLKRIAQSAGIGAALGGLGGAGAAEDVASIPGKVAEGATLGGLFSLGGEGVASGVRGVKNVLMPNVPYFGGAAARTAAQGRVANAAAQDERTAPMMLARLSKMGDEARVADVAGQSTRDLLDTMATLPGATRNKVENLIRARRATMPARLDEAAIPLSGGARAMPTLEAWQAAKEAAAKPAYAAVENVIVPITPRLEDLMRRPAFQEAFDQAVTNAANRGEQMPMLEDLLKSGPVSGVKVRFWDDVKKGLDDVVVAKKRGLDTRSPSNKNQAQSTLSSTLDTKHELVSEIDRLTEGAYKRARDAYAGPAALQSALTDGMDLWKMSTNDIKETIAKLSKSEREAFRIGAGEAMREKAGSPSGQSQLLAAWKDRNLREKLQAVYDGPKQYHEALAVILREERLRRLEAVGRGSKTGRVMADTEDFNLGVVSDAAQAAKAATSGSFTGALQAARQMYGRVATPESVRNEIGRILMAGGPAARGEIQSLEQIIADIGRRNAQQAAFTGLLGGALPQL